MSFPHITIEEVCDLITDGTHYTPPDIGEGVPFLTVKDLNSSGLNFKTCSKISGDEYKKANSGNSSPKVGDVLFSKDGTVGKVHVVSEQEDFAVLSSIAILRPNKKLVDSDYFGKVLQTQATLDQAVKKKTGSAIRRIILSDLKRVFIPLPPLEEQKRIAAILDKADSIRRKRRQAIDLTDQLLRSVFLDIFGDPVTNPKGWPIESLGEHLSFVTSGSRGWAKYYSDTGALFIRSLDVRMNELVFDDATFILPPDNAEAKRTLVYKGDVLLTITGSKIGRVSPVRDELGRAHISQHVAILRPNKTIIDEYAAMFLSDVNGGQKQIKESSYGQTKPGLNLEQIKNFQIPIPPVELQDQYLQIAHEIRSFNSRLDQSVETVENLNQSLNINAFRGDLSRQTEAA